MSDKYGFGSEFEQAVAFFCATRPSFFGRIGRVLDPELMSSDDAALIVGACKSIAEDTGSGPSTELIVIQRLKRWCEEGKIAKSQILSVVDYLGEAEDSGLPTEEELLVEVVPVVKSMKQRDALEHANDEFIRTGDISQLSEEIRAASRIGAVDLTPGIKVGQGSFSEIERMRALDRCPIGIIEVDAAINGGLLREGLGCVIGGTGGGKSMTLIHLLSNALHLGMNVCLASLELPEFMQIARIKANLTGIPIDELVSGSTDIAKKRLEELAPQMGNCYVKYFTAGSTGVQDLNEWMNVCEQHMQSKVDLLVVDYADKLGDPGSTHDYSLGKVVFEGLRGLAVERNMWVWTASQPKRRKDKGIIDTDDVADSMHKSRIADLIITLNPDDSGDITYFIAKNRVGVSKAKIGPIPHDWAFGRQVKVSRGDPWEQAVRVRDPNERYIDWGDSDAVSPEEYFGEND